jgi:DNA-binding protein HU-beta
MNKQELIEALAKKAKSSSKVEAARHLNTFLQIVKDELKKGKNVALTGFGTFSVSKRKARMGVNPQTGKKIKIPAMKVPKFKAGKGLKKVVK